MDGKKRRNELKRSERKAKDANYRMTQLQNQRAAEKYPEIHWIGDAEPQFKDLIKSAAASVSFDSPAFPDWEQRLYRCVRTLGFAEANERLNWLVQDDLKNHPGTFPKRFWFRTNFGHQVFLNAGPSLPPLLKTNDVQFDPYGTKIVGVFRQMSTSLSGDGRLLRFSPLKNTVFMDGRVRTLAFGDHFFDWLHERLLSVCTTYAGHGDVFPVLYNQHRISACRLWNPSKGSYGPAVSLFQDMPLGSQNTFPIQSVINSSLRDDGSGLFVRVSYCPVAFDGEFAIAKTFLPPGFRQTPEAALYDDPAFDAELRANMRRIGTDESPGKGILHSDLQLLQFFDRHGFPQVVRGSDPCFAQPPQDG
ncbi:MAG: hypothetical protein SH850_05905 [Planctomycetaceae bacterium]|nr:hypothetical protein [Planctomycetaceae bacterium]